MLERAALGRGEIGEALDPGGPRLGQLVAKPGPLTARVGPSLSLDVVDRLVEVGPLLEVGAKLLVAEAAHGLEGRMIAGRQQLLYLAEPALGHHRVATCLNLGTKALCGGFDVHTAQIDAQAWGVLRTHFAHRLAQSLAQPKRTHGSNDVLFVDARGGRGVAPREFTRDRAGRSGLACFPVRFEFAATRILA